MPRNRSQIFLIKQALSFKMIQNTLVLFSNKDKKHFLPYKKGQPKFHSKSRLLISMKSKLHLNYMDWTWSFLLYVNCFEKL